MLQWNCRVSVNQDSCRIVSKRGHWVRAHPVAHYLRFNASRRKRDVKTDALLAPRNARDDIATDGDFVLLRARRRSCVAPSVGIAMQDPLLYHRQERKPLAAV